MKQMKPQTTISRFFNNKLFLGAIFAVFIFLVLFVILKFLTQKIELDINYYYIFMAVSAAILGNVLLALRWEVNLYLIKKRIPLIKLFCMESIGKMLKFLTPFQLNIPYRYIFLKKYNIPGNAIVSFSIFELFVELVVSLSCVMVLGFIFTTYLDNIYIFLILLAVIFLFLIGLSSSFLISKINFKNKILNKIKHYISITIKGFNLFIKKPYSLLFLSSYTFIFFLLRVLHVYFVVLALSMDIPFAYLFFVVIVSFIAGALSRIPGGLGVTEATGVLLLQQYGTAYHILSIFIIDRIITTSSILTLGIFFALITHTNLFSLLKHLNRDKKNKYNEITKSN